MAILKGDIPEYSRIQAKLENDAIDFELVERMPEAEEASDAA